MKKYNMVFPISGFIFAITGVLATKSSKKYSAVTQGVFYITGSYTGAGSISLPNGHFTTIINAYQSYFAIYTNSSGGPNVFASAPIKTIPSVTSNVFNY